MSTSFKMEHISHHYIPCLVHTITFRGLEVPQLATIETCGIVINEFHGDLRTGVVELLKKRVDLANELTSLLTTV